MSTMKKHLDAACSFLASKLFWLSLLAGLVLVLLGYSAHTALDKADVRRVAQQTLSSVSGRLQRYENYMANEKSKSLIRLLDKANELSRCLAQETADRSGFLADYVHQQRLTGVILLDGQVHMETRFPEDPILISSLDQSIVRTQVETVAQYPKKAYLTRLTTPGGTFDFAAVARQDGPGVVVAYVRKETDEFSEDDISLDTMFEGDNYNLEGVVVVSNGTSILASNVSDLQGTPSDQFLAYFDHQLTPDRSGLIHLSYQGKDWYGARTSSGSYRLYAFFPASAVFATRTGALGYTLAAYILLLTVFTVLRHRSSRATLRQLEKQYRTISAVSSIYSSCFLFSLDGRSVEVIRAQEDMRPQLDQLTRPQQVVDLLVQKHVTPAYRQSFRAFTDLSSVERRLTGASSLSCPFEDLSGRWMSAVLIPQEYDDGGGIQSVLLLLRDMTAEKRRELDYQEQLRQAAQQAERANLAKTDFLRRMSHDVRTPINGIRGMVAISRHYAGDETKQEECREKILSASGFLLDLVNDVLDMNKLESGSVQLEERPFSLGEVMESVLSIIEIRAGERGVVLHREVMDVVHDRLIGSPLHLRQILLNISSNAVKYNHPGGSVAISCRELPPADPAVRGPVTFTFTCADTGVGMSQEFQTRAFEPFAQEDTTVHSTYSGTGLGLPIAKELVEHIGGSISFVSQQGKGTTFTIVLPFLPDPDSAAPAAPVPVEELPSIAGARVLLAEDNDMNREITRFVLEKQGVQVVEALDGRQAVEAFAQSAPGSFDVVLMDVMMPVMDGLEATRRIRSMDRPDAKTVPIFALTANAFVDDQVRSRKAGMNEHLPKPLDAPKLILLIRKYLRQ
jgi:signal transduction histidine kinase/ActR/RegA family two-component response regulator